MSEKNVLSEHLGLVKAPLDQVRDVVLAVPTGELSGPEVPFVLGGSVGRKVTVAGGPTAFTADVAGVPIGIEVDRDAGWVQAHGQWWWCARLQVEAHPDGALLRRCTYNRATGAAARLVPFTVGRGHRAQGRQSLLALLDDLSARLGCETRPLPG